jgi:uncharacterized protein (DUF1778 family)
LKTITLRVDDDIYQMIKLASEGEKRDISNFVEYATLQYLTSNQYVENEEMRDILNDKELIKSLNKGLREAKEKDYIFV